MADFWISNRLRLEVGLFGFTMWQKAKALQPASWVKKIRVKKITRSGT